MKAIFIVFLVQNVSCKYNVEYVVQVRVLEAVVLAAAISGRQQIL